LAGAEEGEFEKEGGERDGESESVGESGVALDFNGERGEDEQSGDEGEGSFFPPGFIGGEGLVEVMGAGQVKEAWEEVGADAEDRKEEEALIGEQALELDPGAGEFGVVVLCDPDGGGGDDAGESEGGEDKARGWGV
jgi:hypothetical protein